MVKPASCCNRSGGECVCASKAVCSCGKQSALHCSCERAASENKVEGPRCSCRECFPPPPSVVSVATGLRCQGTVLMRCAGARPAGSCTCDRAATENAAVGGEKCACGVRAAGTSNLCFLEACLASSTSVLQVFFSTVANNATVHRVLLLREGRHNGWSFRDRDGLHGQGLNWLLESDKMMI